jgi:hypothetical protein
MTVNSDLLSLMCNKSAVNVQLIVIAGLLLSGCTSDSIVGSLKSVTNKYVDCTYVDEDNKCTKPRVRLFNSKYGSVSTRVTLGKRYLIQYRYKF